ncbi:MAG: TatD family hydrolase [Pseudomonadota bacterium]
MGRKHSTSPAPPGLGLIDSHAHLDGASFGEDRDAVLERAWAAGLGGIVVVAAAGAGTVFREVADLVADSPRLWMVAGVHPHDADRSDGLWGGLVEVVDEGRCVAIGETGLDHFYDHSTRAGQVRSFERHIGLALDRSLPLVLHVRDAHREALEVLDAHAPGWRGVVHCFTGGPAEAEDWLERGFHLSIPGVVTFPKCGALADAVRRIPEDRLLVETDSPYLAPEPWRGRRNEPARVVWTAQEIAVLREQLYEDLVEVLNSNTLQLFSVLSI